MHVAVLTGAGLTVEVPRALDINCCMNIPEPTLASARHHALLSAAAPSDPPCTSGRLAITHKTEPAQPKQACFGSKATRGMSISSDLPGGQGQSVAKVKPSHCHKGKMQH